MWEKIKFFTGVANFFSFLFVLLFIFLYLYFSNVDQWPPLPGIAVILLIVSFLSGYYLLKRNREFSSRQLNLIGFLELVHALFVLPFGWFLYSRGYEVLVDQYDWPPVAFFICQSILSIANIYFFESKKRLGRHGLILLVRTTAFSGAPIP